MGGEPADPQEARLYLGRRGAVLPEIGFAPVATYNPIMSRFPQQRSGEPSQRQLRVGELVRHALAEVFARGDGGPEFDGLLISFAEVRMSADLKHATVLVAPLAARDPGAVVENLNRNASRLRGRIAPALRQMRSMPDLKFRLDTRFEDDARIDELLKSPEVARDLGPEKDEE